MKSVTVMRTLFIDFRCNKIEEIIEELWESYKASKSKQLKLAPQTWIGQKIVGQETSRILDVILKVKKRKKEL